VIYPSPNFDAWAMVQLNLQASLLPRASVMCETEEVLVAVIRDIKATSGVKILRCKNRFLTPTPGNAASAMVHSH
jgi:hypothetical protein